MSTKYLGGAFDIHGGGLDLRFPHHENELAQSRAAGDQFANFWLHNGLVNVAGQKMSKSLGNSVYAADLLAAGSPLAVRFWLGSANYRSTLDYSETSITEAQANVDRISTFLDRGYRALGEGSDWFAVAATPLQHLAQYLPAAFVAAMDEDLNIPVALATIFDSVRAGNAAIDAGDSAAVKQQIQQVRAMLSVLGIDPMASEWAAAATGNQAEHQALDALIQSLLQQRQDARANKDFARADEIRNQLSAAGIVLSDSADATHWSVNG